MGWDRERERERKTGEGVLEFYVELASEFFFLQNTPGMMG